MLDHDTRRLIRLKRSEHNLRLALELDREDGINHCYGCGCPTDTYSEGCTRCNDRRRQKNKRRELRPPAPEHGRCAGCGTHWNSYTVGCRHCMDRRWKRRGRAAA